jgi:hypothetical protein
MILKLTTNDKASIWVNLSRILQMTLIDAQDGYPQTQIVLDNGAVIGSRGLLANNVRPDRQSRTDVRTRLALHGHPLLSI